MKDDQHHPRKRREKRSDSPEWGSGARPAELKPMQLRNDPARDIPASPLVARAMPLVNPGDTASPAKPISERRFDFQPLSELRPELKREVEMKISLQQIPVSSVQMQRLQERRIGARDLGWVIPGGRIRVESGE